MTRLSIAEKYAQPDIVNFWRKFSEQGLQYCEEAMLACYAPPPAHVLDLGCGSGRAGLALASSGYTVTGIDLVWEMIHAARDEYQRTFIELRLVQADMRAIPCADAQHDVALVFIAAVQHVEGCEARRHAFVEIARVLRPGGVLILAIDNLAPALTCYAWWAWRKLTSISRPSRRMLDWQPASADRMLQSRRSGMSALTWHARGVARTLRWRTWNGIVDLARKAHLLRGEAGDTAIDQVSLMTTPGLVYYHIYRHAELVADVEAGGFALMGYHSGRELSEDQTFTPRVRQLDKQVLYGFRRL